MYGQPKMAAMTALVGLIFAIVGGSAWADSLAVSNTFVAGTPATAASVNQNFDDVEAAVNDNDSRITTNTGNIADNFSMITGNTADIDNLKIGQRPAVRTFVDIDCNANPDVLLQPPISDNFHPYTTFNITGVCNGPLYITSDGVRLVGQDANRGATIVLPASTPSPSDGTVAGDGAHDLRIENMTIDASAWGTAAAQGTDAAGVYARNAFLRLIDVDVIGGLYGINPYRNALVRLQGTINVTEFVNEGITVGDQSLVTTRGQVNVSSTRTDGNYLSGVAAYRSGVIDLRGGLVVSLPAQLANSSGTNAIESGDNSLVRVRNNGTINISGGTSVSLYRSGNAVIEGGTIDGNVFAGGGSRLLLNGVTQTSGNVSITGGSGASIFNGAQVNGLHLEENSSATIGDGTTIDGNISVSLGSSFRSFDSTQTPGLSFFLNQNASAVVINSSIGILSVSRGASLEISNGSFEGGLLNLGAIGTFFDASTSANLTILNSMLEYNASGPGSYLNGNTVDVCSAIYSSIDANVTASGTVSGCP